MQHATVPEEAANIMLKLLVRERVQNALNGVFQGIKEMSGQTPEKDQAVVRFALLNMVERAFLEILEEQRFRVSSYYKVPNNQEKTGIIQRP